MTRDLREICAERAALGAWAFLPSPAAAEALAVEGFDYVCIDCQHGLIDDGDALQILHALSWTGVTPVVRVLSNDAGRIGKTLDAGAEVIIVPLVDSPEAAAAAARACRYPPDGGRSFGPTRASLFLGSDPVEVNRRIMCLVMIESKIGVDRADEILATPGVDGVYIGPRDLGISLGIKPGTEPMPAAHGDAIAEVLAACGRTGTIPGIHAGTGDVGRRYAEMGFRFITVAGDITGMRAAAKADLAVARGASLP